MFGWFTRENLSLDRTRGAVSPASRRWWLSIVVVCACAGVAGTAVAEDAECTYKQILSRGDDKAASVKTDDTIRSYEHELELCRDRVSISDQRRTLLCIIGTYLKNRTFLKNNPADFDGCRRVAERGIQIVGVGGPAGEINESFGYCGGDCRKAACVPCCEVGVRKRQKEIEEENRKPRTDEEIEMDQVVPCDSKKVRHIIAGLDKAAFRDSALHVIAKYRNTCAKQITPAVLEALANDEALVFFHLGDDVACLKALSRLPAPDSGGTAFNRALGSLERVRDAYPPMEGFFGDA